MSPLSVPERRALVAKLHAAGLHAEPIGDALEVSPRTVGRDLASVGLTPQRRGRPRRADAEPPATLSLRRELEGLVESAVTQPPSLLERTRKLLELYRRGVHERLRTGGQATPSEVLALAELERRVEGLETLKKLNALTRHPRADG